MVQYTEFNNDDIEAAFKRKGAPTSPRARATKFHRPAAPPEGTASETAAAALEGVTEDTGPDHEPEDGGTTTIPTWTQSITKKTSPETPVTAEPAKSTTSAAAPPETAATLAAIISELLDGHERQFLAAGSKAAEETAKKIASILATISTDKLGERMLQSFDKLLVSRYVKRLCAWPAVLIIVGVLLAMFCGIFALGATYERWMLGAAFASDVAAIDSSPSMHDRRVQIAVGSLLAENSPAILIALARCSADVGLRKVRSASGDTVCVGGQGAKFGFRAVPSELR